MFDLQTTTLHVKCDNCGRELYAIDAEAINDCDTHGIAIVAKIKPCTCVPKQLPPFEFWGRGSINGVERGIHHTDSKEYLYNIDEKRQCTWTKYSKIAISTTDPMELESWMAAAIVQWVRSQ